MSIEKQNSIIDQPWTKKIFVLTWSAFAAFVIIKQSSNTGNESTNKKSNSDTVNCFFGDESCVTKLREEFSKTGKTILGEEYLKNGKFGISFMDAQHPGAAYNV